MVITAERGVGAELALVGWTAIVLISTAHWLLDVFTIRGRYS